MKNSDVPFEIRVDVLYAQPKHDPFGFRSFDEIGGRQTQYESIPGHHAFHREFIVMSGALERAARDHGAGWSVEKELKEPESSEYDIARTSRAAYDGGYADLLYQAAVVTSTVGIGFKLIKAIQPALVEWIKGRAGVTVSVKVGDTHVSVTGKQDVDEILKLLKSVTENAQRGATGSAKKARSTKKQTPSSSKTASARKSKKQTRSSSTAKSTPRPTRTRSSR